MPQEPVQVNVNNYRINVGKRISNYLLRSFLIFAKYYSLYKSLYKITATYRDNIYCNKG